MFFLSGLPRSGSTLMTALLNQNPDFYAGPNSPVCGIMSESVKSILGSEQYKTFPKPEVMGNIVGSLLYSYYSNVNHKYVVDKSRAWGHTAPFDFLRFSLPYEPRIILMVRDINEILASVINLVHKHSDKVTFLDKEIEVKKESLYIYRAADDVRCDWLMRPKGLVDTGLYSVAKAMDPQFKKNFLIVEYNDLVKHPQTTMDRIYAFLEVPSFTHDFENIITKPWMKEDDESLGIPDLHEVRTKLEKSKTNPQKILSPYIFNKYKNYEFWRNK